MKRIFIISTFIILSYIITGCGSANKDAEDADLTVYTSIYPIQYIVEEITGDLADVQSVYPPGVDAHTYEPTSKMITSIANSDAFIYLGAGVEGFAESAAASLSSQNVVFVEIGKHEELFTADRADVDPHIWLDPLRMIEMGEIIKEELTTIAPNDAYESNFQTFKDNMMALDQSFNETFRTKSIKEIVVSHAAYGYWEERYGIKQIAISGLSSGDEPSQKDLANIAKLAKELELKYVIFEQNGSDRVSTIIQDYIGAEALQIHNLEVLTEEDIKNNEDYISLMEKNIKTLDKATK